MYVFKPDLHCMIIHNLGFIQIWIILHQKMVWIKKISCLFENLVLGKLLNFFTDLPSVAYKMVAYKKEYV